MVEQQLINEYNEKHRIVVTFNKETLQQYTDDYFYKYPTRKALPLKWLGAKRNGQLPSWNRFINCPNRITQNQWKQDLCDYTYNILRRGNIKPYMFDKCVVVAKQYQPTRAKSDSDNIYLKGTLDAFVKWGLLEEDNYTVLNPCILYTNYNKENPRTEVMVYPINEVYTHSIVLDMIMNEFKEEL